MLATITLAADNDWVGVWIGSTVGMVAADALAIIVGAVLGKHLPERFIQLAAATLFFVFGVMLLLQGLFPGTPAGPIAGGVDPRGRRRGGWCTGTCGPGGPPPHLSRRLAKPLDR